MNRRATTTGPVGMCPQDPNHGPLLLMDSGRLWCPHAKHRKGYMYDPSDLSPAPEKKKASK